MINVVIPMAGAGLRFNNSCFTVPKPFIVFEDKMMVEHVISSFNEVNCNFVLVIQEKFQKEQNMQLSCLNKKYNITFVTVPRLTMGASITALAAHKAIESNCDIIFADSDNIFNSDDIKNFINFARLNNLDGALLTFNSNDPCYSYVKTNSNGFVTETREKEAISNQAICGVYYFKNIELFKDATIDLVVENDTVKNEFYMSNVFNHLLKFTKNIKTFSIDSFDCVGTPAQLDEYLKRRQFGKVQ